MPIKITGNIGSTPFNLELQVDKETQEQIIEGAVQFFRGLFTGVGTDTISSIDKSSMSEPKIDPEDNGSLSVMEEASSSDDDVVDQQSFERLPVDVEENDTTLEVTSLEIRNSQATMREKLREIFLVNPGPLTGNDLRSILEITTDDEKVKFHQALHYELYKIPSDKKFIERAGHAVYQRITDLLTEDINNSENPDLRIKEFTPEFVSELAGEKNVDFEKLSEKIKSIISAFPGAEYTRTVSEISTFAGVTIEYTYLCKLLRENKQYFERIKKGHYKLTDQGRSAWRYFDELKKKIS